MLTPSSPRRSPVSPARTGRDEPGRIRVLLVDDHPAVRAGVRDLIDEQPVLRVVAEFATAKDTIEQLDHPIDVAIVDYDLGAAEDGLWLTAELKCAEAPSRVLVYSGVCRWRSGGAGPACWGRRAARQARASAGPLPCDPHARPRRTPPTRNRSLGGARHAFSATARRPGDLRHAFARHGAERDRGPARDHRRGRGPASLRHIGLAAART